MKMLRKWAESQGHSVVVNPSGEQKMSEVLDEFVEPFKDLFGSDTLEGHRKLLNLAVAAWNIALFPEDEQAQYIEELIEKGFKKLNAEDKKLTRSLIQSMIDRKNSHFPGIKRAILSFELTDTGDGFHLNVASTL
jgi:hypothetical protein